MRLWQVDFSQKIGDFRLGLGLSLGALLYFTNFFNLATQGKILFSLAGKGSSKILQVKRTVKVRAGQPCFFMDCSKGKASAER